MKEDEEEKKVLLNVQCFFVSASIDLNSFDHLRFIDQSIMSMFMCPLFMHHALCLCFVDIDTLINHLTKPLLLTINTLCCCCYYYLYYYYTYIHHTCADTVR